MTSPLSGDGGKEGGSYFMTSPLAGDGGEEEGELLHDQSFIWGRR